VGRELRSGPGSAISPAEQLLVELRTTGQPRAAVPHLAAQTLWAPRSCL